MLVSLIRKKLKPGGLLYIWYDCMPGWAGIAPLRRILVQGFAPSPGLPSSLGIEQALAYSDALRKVGSRYHQMFPLVEGQIDRLKKTPRPYLAHELLTRDWEAFSFGDVVGELSEAKLAYVGSAHLTDSGRSGKLHRGTAGFPGYASRCNPGGILARHDPGRGNFAATCLRKGLCRWQKRNHRLAGSIPALH